MAASLLSSNDLIELARRHYRSQGWTVPSRPNKAEATLVSSLARRPDFVVRRDGMLHLVFVSGKVTAATFRLNMQVVFDVQQTNEVCNLVTVCQDRVKPKDERELRKMGFGILIVRESDEPYFLAPAKLQQFDDAIQYEQIPQRLRARTRAAVRQISEGDVCVGILDLVQIVEAELERHVPGSKNWTLGRKINAAETSGVLRPMMKAAADRINFPRIKRAHPGTHNTRRKWIVSRAQAIVDDCLAILFGLP